MNFKTSYKSQVLIKRVNMNLEKLKDMEAEFLTFYPKGFEDAKFFPTMKKFNPSKLEEFTKENLKKENFSNPNLVLRLDRQHCLCTPSSQNPVMFYPH